MIIIIIINMYTRNRSETACAVLCSGTIVYLILMSISLIHCSQCINIICNTVPLATGILIRATPSLNGSTSPRHQPYKRTRDTDYGWQGYSITKGRFQNVNIDGKSLMHIIKTYYHTFL